ncbi:rRNA small subunit methyltransferase B [Moorella glycerini]|uniref:16S rRNA (cytosine(967)-C(5))-methyltransferase n=1 Tax=Neomoorella stamsii TaxID=1266720 RepID=A0A9X7P5Y3_9FIRM|nr:MULTISPECIES: 16S rRNA (cytosine(967)-C(5))-methyltransferase RsmB [Moorella]PRR72147.1 Ribosomal RNA small subunit methyltransferase B [Moorella stamsii]CEP69448.1 rRNA small subunit methyltransferase B [Moorella glycerini]
MKLRPAASAREAALQVIYRVTEEGAFASLALDEVLQASNLEGRDRTLATELAYSAIKAWQTLDWALGLFLKHPLAKLPPWIRCLLRLGGVQLMYLPRIPARAAIYETVELAKKYGHRGTVGLVNGVLRHLDRRKDDLPYPDPGNDPAGYLSLRYYHPRWLVEKWLAQFGYEETEALCRADNEPALMVIRTNTLKTTVAGLAARLQDEGATVRPARYAPEGLIVEGLGAVKASPSFREGLFYVQDEGSQLVGHALKPEPGSIVIDASAAPGGKTTHLAQLMVNRGTILACDVHPSRLELIKENCRRLGVTCVRAVLADARELGQRYPEVADYLLIDAPCSGLGVLRRRPDARWRKELAGTWEMARLQLEILLGARRALKPDGVLVYSTCSLAPEENQEVIRQFLDRAREFSLVSLEPWLPVLPADLEVPARQGWVQYLPQRHGTDGFFIARLKREENRGF